MGGAIYHFDRSGNHQRVLESPMLYDNLSPAEIAVGPNGTIYLVDPYSQTLTPLVPSV